MAAPMMRVPRTATRGVSVIATFRSVPQPPVGSGRRRSAGPWRGAGRARPVEWSVGVFDAVGELEDEVVPEVRVLRGEDVFDVLPRVVLVYRLAQGLQPVQLERDDLAAGVEPAGVTGDDGA